MTKLNIVILAAGMGKRMQSALPKVLHHLGGQPLLARVVETARTLSPEKICVIYGHGGEQVRQALPDNDLVWIEQAEQLGTGHALMQALPALDHEGSTLVLFGDVPLIKTATLAKLVDAAQGNVCALLTAELENPFGYGRIIRAPENGNVVAIVEEKDASPEQKSIREINTGVMLIPNSYLHDWLPKLENSNQQQEYYLTDIISLAVNQGIDIAAVQPENTWEILGVNNKVHLAQLERIFQTENANKLMEQGVTLSDPSRIDIRGQLSCGRDVEIDVNCIFEGQVVLGDNVIVKANCILKNVSVADGAVIAPFSVIEDAEVGASAQIGPFARIRPGSRLGSNVRIGNFVEVKNSIIANASKANHLSYIGDTQIGEHVNIGAGTITCNYDGANKHQTIIEDDVFIGSDTQLIAPVKIAKGTTIGAGSTITHNTPAEKLTLSRSKQVTIDGWQRPVKNKK